MEKKNIIIPWISICCLLFGMYAGFATEFNYGGLNWWFLVIWTAVLSAVAVLVVLQWKTWISGLLTVPALILAGLYGYSHSEELEKAVDVIQMLLSRQMAKYNGTAVLSDATGTANTWGIRGSLREGQMETLFLLCGFFIAVYICIVTMRLSFRIYGLIVPYTIVLVGLSVGASPGVRSVFFLFLGTALTLYWVERNEADSPGQKEKETGLHFQIPWALAVLCLCIVLCTATSILLNNGTQEKILSHAKTTLAWQHQKERQLKEFGKAVTKAIKARFGVDNDGKLGNEAPEYGDKDVLQFTMDRKPTEDIYLRGFTGVVYHNGRWISEDHSEELAEEIDEIVMGKPEDLQVKDEDEILYLSDKVNTQKLYLMQLDTVGLMRTANKDSEGLSGVYPLLVGLPSGPDNLQIKYPEVHWKIEYVGAGKISGVYYHPYFDWMEDTVSNGALRGRKSVDVRYALLYGGYGTEWDWQIDRTMKKLSDSVEGTFYPMNIQRMQERADFFGEWAEEDDRNWSDLSAANIELRDDVLKAYLADARRRYTRVPRDLKKFKEFADNQGIYGGNVADIAIQIRGILMTSATYSKNLEMVPKGKDYVEYFLLEQKKGFCEHFATAGTLLFRRYGVPAKFVSGYRIPVEAFVDNGNGTYTANVQDSYSHAWSEVLVGGLGWYPMEMTPGAADIVRGQYDDEDAEPTETPEPTKEAVETAMPTPIASENPQAAGNSATPAQKGGNWRGVAPVLWWVIVAGVFILLCLSAWIWRRYSRGKYSRELKRFRGQNSRAVRIMTEGLLCFLADCGVNGCEKMTEREWIAQAFAMAEGDEITVGNQTDMDSMRQSIEKAFFANEAVTSKEYEKFVEICDALTGKILLQMKGWHKFTILLFGWRKQFAEWKKLCYDRTK